MVKFSGGGDRSEIFTVSYLRVDQRGKNTDVANFSQGDQVGDRLLHEIMLNRLQFN